MESTASNFSLWNIFPHFSTLFGGGQAGETLTAWFVLIILCILSWFSFKSFAWYRKAKARVRFFQSLIEGVDAQQLAERRRSMAQAAIDESQTLGKLWKEFDESLVESKDMPFLRNTLDANHFFSTHTLASELTENRLLAAVPGFLTAVGVIGTFIGLSIGLAGLNFDSTEVDQLKTGIFEMVAGASVAFVTSVWGVFSSLVFNFGEKYLERKIRHDIFWLQNQIDFLYPRITAEQSLVTIADTGKNTDLAIQGLAEKLGDKLQEAVESVSNDMLTGIETALKEIMDPAIKSLVNNANNGAQAALDNLVGNFMDKMGEAGQEQRDAMNKTSEKVSAAASLMGENLENFSSELQTQTKDLNKTFSQNLEKLDEREADRARAFNESLNALNDRDAKRDEELQNQADKLNSVFADNLASIDQREADRTRAFNESLDALNDRDAKRDQELQNQANKLNEVFAENLAAIDARDIQRNKDIEELVSSVVDVTSQMTERFKDVITVQEQSVERIFGKLEDLEPKLTQVVEEARLAGESMNGIAEKLTLSANEISTMTTHFSEASEALEACLDDTAELITKSQEQYASCIEQAKSLTGSLTSLSEKMTSAAEMLDEASEVATDGLSDLDERLNGFTQSLRTQLSVLQDQAANLMSSIAKQVEDQTVSRMGVWNDETQKFTSQMTSAVNAFAAVVDDLEGKVGA